MSKLSVIIIAKNEENMILPALKTSQFADEIILIDTGSTDDTIKVSKPFVKKIIKSSGSNFSTWRNLGAKEATGDWLLYLDSDERIPKALAQEIKGTIEYRIHDAYTIPRYEVLLGKHLKHWPDPRVLRLIKKSSLTTWQGKLHEQPNINGTIGELKNHLLHLTHKNIDEKVLKTLQWSRLEADLLLKAKHPKMSGWRLWRILLTEFWYRFVKQGLWKDGTEGNIEVIYQMFSRFVTYVRLWEAQANPSLKKKYKLIDQKVLKEWKE